MSHRKDQPQRGIEAVEFLAKFLEQQHGILTVSIHESGYSAGSKYSPDMVFMNYAIEIKRVELLTSTIDKKNRHEFRAHLNDLKVNSDSWMGMKEFCKKNKKIPILVVVLTWGKQEPTFIGFNESQIDQFQNQCSNRPAAQPEYTPEGEPYYPHHKSTNYTGWFFGINSWKLIQQGVILNQSDLFHKFFNCLAHSATAEIYEKPLKIYS